jgi:hypothetical protein
MITAVLLYLKLFPDAWQTRQQLNENCHNHLEIEYANAVRLQTVHRELSQETSTMNQLAAPDRVEVWVNGGQMQTSTFHRTAHAEGIPPNSQATNVIGQLEGLRFVETTPSRD